MNIAMSSPRYVCPFYELLRLRCVDEVLGECLM